MVILRIAECCSLGELFMSDLVFTPGQSFSRLDSAFTAEIAKPGIDERWLQRSPFIGHFDAFLVASLEAALPLGASSLEENVNGFSEDSSRLFLQRVLYRINRLRFFWFDDLQNYSNEDSVFLNRVRRQIESRWCKWEEAHRRKASTDVKKGTEAQAVIQKWCADDKAPRPFTEEESFLADSLQLEGYKQLLKIFSLDALVEASNLSRVVAGVSNEVHNTLVKLLIEE
jgi:hypothetical protein